MEISLPNIHFVPKDQIQLHQFYLHAIEDRFTCLIFLAACDEDGQFTGIVFDHGHGVRVESLTLKHGPSRLLSVSPLLIEPTLCSLEKPRKLRIGDLCMNSDNGFGFITSVPGPDGGQAQLFDLRTMKVMHGGIVGRFPSYGIYYPARDEVEALYCTSEDGQRE